MCVLKLLSVGVSTINDSLTSKTTIVSGVVARPVMLRTLHPKTHSKYFFS